MNLSTRLVSARQHLPYKTEELTSFVGIVADSADQAVSFHATTPYDHGAPVASSISSLAAETASIMNYDVFDFSPYMDKVSYQHCDQYDRYSNLRVRRL